MMADEDDEDIWYGKAKSGLIQTNENANSGLEDTYLKESRDACLLHWVPGGTAKSWRRMR